MNSLHVLVFLRSRAGGMPCWEGEADAAEAAKWYRYAARGGDREAQWKLGNLCLEGIGAPKNKEIGLAWIERSAASGYFEARAQLEIRALREGQ